MSQKKTVVVSGGFDPLHVGHIRMMNDARALGDRLVVILNNDNWLCSKKGYVFMNEEERKEVLLSLGSVDDVIISSHDEGDLDRSVSRDLEKIKPDIFANGGDRDEVDAKSPTSSLYKDIQKCKDLGIEMVFGVGAGGKVQSSSWLTDTVRSNKEYLERPWGSMVLHEHGDNFWIKTITIKSGAQTSLQKHEKRGELWMCISGSVYALVNGEKKTLKPFDVVSFGAGVIHRLGSESSGTIIEIGHGECLEEDIVRLEDDYDRK